MAEVQGSHRVPSLYALAVIDAEGGHYDHAVMHAQQALKAAEAQQQDSGAAGSFIAPVIALLGLLLSARSVVVSLHYLHLCGWVRLFLLLVLDRKIAERSCHMVAESDCE